MLTATSFASSAGNMIWQAGDSNGFHPSLRESRHPLPRKHWPVARHSEGRTAAVNTFGS